MKKLSYILLCGLMLILSACEKDTESANFAPVVTTGSASNIYRMGATLSGSIQLTETNTAKEYGILVSSFESMAESTEYPVKDGSTSFNILVQGLEPNETYYYCTYASSGYSIAKSEIKSFTTTQSNPPVFSEIILQSKNERSCKVSVGILDEGGSEILISGFCWKEIGNGDPTIYDNVTNVQIHGSSMSGTIIGMESDKTYIVRAYAQNQSGLSYSKSLTVTTSTAIVPILSNVLPLDSTEVSIMVQSSVVDSGLGGITEYGFCYSTESNAPTINHLITEHIQGDTDNFSAVINGLKPNTTYYIRAYAMNKEGTGYSETYIYTGIKQEEPEEPDSSVKKLLTNISSRDGKEIWDFTYDSNDKIKTITNKSEEYDGEYSSSSSIFSLEYLNGGNSIKVVCHSTEEDEDGKYEKTVTYDITLNKEGYIENTSTLFEDEDDNLTISSTCYYNIERQLVSLDHKNLFESYNIKYDKNNDAVYASSYEFGEVNATYGSLENKSNFVYPIVSDELGLEIFGWVGLLGKPSKHFPTRIDDEFGTTLFEWETDKDGYPTKIILTDENNEKDTATLTWTNSK